MLVKNYAMVRCPENAITNAIDNMTQKGFHLVTMSFAGIADVIPESQKIIAAGASIQTQVGMFLLIFDQEIEVEDQNASGPVLS